jgi:hypothetical protein
MGGREDGKLVILAEVIGEVDICGMGGRDEVVDTLASGGVGYTNGIVSGLRQTMKEEK